MDFAGMKRRDLQALCKRHGLPAGGSNAALAARLADAALLPGAAGAEDEVVATKGCLKRPDGGNDLGETKKVCFALEESRRRRQSLVTCSPAVVARTRGRSKAAAETRPASSPDPEAGRRGRGQQMRAGAVGGSADEDSVSAEAGACAPVRRSRRNSVGLGGVEAVEVGETVAVDRKRKQRSQEKEEETAVSAQIGVPCRVTRRSSLSGAALLLPIADEKKRGRGKAADGKSKLDAEEQVAEAQALDEAMLPAVAESMRNGRKRENCDLVVQKSAKMEAPIVIESKRRRTTEYEQPQVELPTVLEVPRNDAPVTRTLRNRVVQVNSSVVEETHVGQELENKRQSSRSASRRNQQLASSMEEEHEEKVPAPIKCPPLRRSRRNNLEPSIADSETNKLNTLPIEANSAKGEDMEKQPTAKEPVRRFTRKSIVSAMLEKEDNDLVAEKGSEPEAHVTRAKRKSFVPVKNIQYVSEEFQNAKGDGVVKQPAVKEPARRSTRKSITSAMLEEGDKDLVAEKGPQPEAHVTKLKRKSVVPVKNIQDVYEDFQNAKGDDVVKHPAVKEAARRSTRKSIVSAMLDEGNKDLVAEKGPQPEARVTRLKQKSVVPVNNIQDVYEDFHNAKGDDVVKQPAVKEPVRRSTRKSVVSTMLDEGDKNLIAEKSPESHVKTLKRKSVVPVKGNKSDGEETQDAKGKDVAIQPAVKEPVRRSTRKSVVSTMLVEEDKILIAHKSPEAQVRTLKRKSVVPVKDSKGDGEGTQNAKVEDVVNQLTIKVPVRRSTRNSFASVMLEKEENDLIAAKKPEAHDRRSVRKSVLPNMLNKENQDHSKKARNEGKGGDEDKGALVKTRKRKSVVPIKDNKGDGEETQDAKGKDVAKQPAVKEPVRRSTRTSVVSAMLVEEDKNLVAHKSPEPQVRTLKRKSVVPVKDSKGDGVIKEAIHDTVTHGNESSSRIQEICQVNATGEELSSGPLPVTLHEETCIGHSRHNVIPGSESADVENPEIYPSHGRKSSDKSKQTREYYDIQIDDGLLSETSNGELDQSTSITELLQHNGIVSEDKILKDVGEVNFGDKGIEIVNASSDEVGLEILNTSSGRSTTAVPIVDAEALPMVESRAVNAEIKQSDTASGSAPPISDSKQESHSIEQSIQAAVGKCLNKDIKGNPLSPNRHSDGADADRILPALDAAKGSSSDESCSSFGLDFLFAEECKRSSSRNDINTVVEVDYGSKPSACVTPSFCMKSDSDVDCENVQPLGYDADKALDVGQGVAQEEFIAEKSSDECVAAEIDLKTKSNYEAVGLYMKSDCILEKNMRLVADNRGDEHAVIQVKQGAVQEGTLEKSSLVSSSLSGSLVDVNNKKEVIKSVELVCEGEGNRKIFHSEDINASCEKSEVDVSASGSAPPISDNKQESHSVEQSIQAAVGKCLNKDIKGNPLSPNLHSDGADADRILPALDAAKGSSSDESRSSFGLDFLFTEECKGSSSRNDINTVVEVDYGSKPSACVTPSFCMKSDSDVECENAQPLGYYADKTLDVGQGVAQEEFIAEKSSDECIAAEIDLKTKSNYEAVGLYMKSDCILEKNTRLVADNHGDEHAVIQVKQGAVQEGTLEKSSLVSSNLSGSLVDVNNKKEVIKSVELVCKGEGNRKIFHSEDINASCEKSEVNVSVNCASGISCTVLSCSLHAPDTENDDVYLGSILAQLESADLLDGPIGSSNTEVQHPSQKEHCMEDREIQVASRPCANDIMEAATAKCIGSGVVLLPVEGSENLKDDQLNSKLKNAQAVECGCNCNKDISSTSDDGSVVGIVGERNSPGFTLPKDYPVDLNDLSVEKSIEESAMSGEENVSNAGTVGNPSFDSAICEHKDALVEEVVHRMNYVGTCPSNPKELLMELQSTPSKGNIEESDLDNFALPISGFGGDESTNVEQCVKVHSGSNLSQLKSNDFLDESIWCSNTEVLHQGHNNQCNGDRTEEQAASGPWTYDTADAATVKYIESEVNLLLVEEKSELQDGQLNSVLESPKAVESSVNNDVVYEKFLFVDKSDSRVGGTIGNSLSGLAPSNHKNKGLLPEEVLNAVNNYVGSCPSNPRELLMELQSSSNETFEDVNPHDNLAFPNTEREEDESTICHVENLVDTVVSSEPDSYLDPIQGFNRDEGKQGCMSVSLHDDEGFLKSNHLKNTKAHLPRDGHNIGRDFITGDVLCEKKEKIESIRSSDCDILHENSHSKGYGICQSSGWMHTDENNSKLSSCETEVLRQDHVEERQEVNEDEVTPAVLESDMSEAAPFERTESTIMLVGKGEKYSFSMSEHPKDCHLDSCQKQEVLDVLSIPKCPEECTDCPDESVLGPGTSYTRGGKCTDESSSTQLTSHIGVLSQDQYNENDELQTTPGFPATGMSEGASLKRSGSVIDVVSAAGSSALRDEQLNPKLEGPEMERHNCVIDKDTSSLFGPESAGKSKASNLPKNTQLDPSSEHDLRNVVQWNSFSDYNLPNDLSAPKSPKNL